MENEGGGRRNWSELVEVLGNKDDIDETISHLEYTIAYLETLEMTDSLELSSALRDLSILYATKGHSIKAEEAQSRELLIRQRWASECAERDCGSRDDSSLCNTKLEDDWEAVADSAQHELLAPRGLPDLSKVSLEDTKSQTPKRRGRGTFSYQKSGTYVKQDFDRYVVDNAEIEADVYNSEGNAEVKDLKYGTRHALILADFLPSVRTTDLEKLLEKFKDYGFVIRWVNDTTALAVFKSPSVALEACNSIQCPFTVRVLDENDELLSSISERDLEPPRQRPKTSTRTAERLIAHGMGLKIPTASFGMKELRKQEDGRRKRIVSRQKLRDSAWGDE